MGIVILMSVDIDFALFYDNRELLYVIPYTYDDHSYVDQMLNSHRIIGSIIPVDWIKFDQQGVESYISRPQSGMYVDDNDSDPYDWSIQSIINKILEGSKFLLSNHYVDILVPNFKKYTGISRDNIEQYRLKNLTQWLSAYNVEYSNNILRRGYKHSGCTADENEGKVTLFGSFSIDANARNEEFIDFLQEYGVIFEPLKKRTGERRYKLHVDAPWDGIEDPIKVMHRDILHDYPHIPMMELPETDYYFLKQSFCLSDSKPMRDVTLEESMDGNEKVVQIFDVEYHEELVLSVVDESKKEVCITNYTGFDREYEVPPRIYLTPDESDPYYVVTIGEKAFAYSEVRRVKLPYTVHELEKGCFMYCSNLESIFLSDGLQYIRSLAFRGCKNLHRIDLPSSVVCVENMSFWLLKELRYACPESAIAEKACNRNICRLIDIAVHDSVVVQEYSSSCNSDSRVEQFISSLTTDEKEYISLIIDKKETNLFLSSISKTASVLERSINNKLSDILDDDDGMFPEKGTLAWDDDGNLEFDLNYNVNLRNLL